MVEAGADEVPEETLLRAFELAHQEIVKICEAQEEPPPDGKPKWLDPEPPKSSSATTAPDRGGHRCLACREAAATVEEIKAALAPELGMSSGDEEIIREPRYAAASTSFSSARG